MSEQNWGCLDKMSEVNFSPAESLQSCGISGSTVHSTLFANIKRSSVKEILSKTKLFGNYNSKPLNIYSGLYQVYCIKQD